jgi:TorA maturation chaperone TorD
MKNINEIEELRSRASTYMFLAHIFKQEVTQQLAEKMDENGLFTLLEDNGYEIKSDELKDKDSIDKLAIEFSRIFIGPGPHISPYGSIHHPDDPKAGRLWGDTTVWVRIFIKDHGLKFEGEGYDGIPDHISGEFEFFSLLINKEIEARESGGVKKTERLLNSQRIFLTQQLSKWVPLFCNKVQEKGELSFYKEIARFTTDLLETEKERLPAEG